MILKKKKIDIVFVYQLFIIGYNQEKGAIIWIKVGFWL